MASLTSTEVERRALALFERLADRTDATRLRARLLHKEPVEVQQRVAALEASAARAAGAIPTLVPGSGDCDGAALPPHKLGAFRLAERIGRGGMGEVWLAHRDDGVYEQKVAIKLIQRRILARAGAAFDDERRFLARLEHPNIARLIDGGQTEDGLGWLAMEYIDGRPIDEACAGLAAAERVTLFIKAADAVQYAHGKMVAHADLKPANIQVDANGRVKLLDFGISVLIGAGPRHFVGSSPFTRDFASPQRLAGGAPGVADDVYALGRTLQLILAGVPDAELHAIAGKALRHDETARYPSVGAMIADLDRWRARLPITALGDAWNYRVRKFVHRHRRGVAATAAAFALLSGSTVFATSNWMRAERNRARAEQRFGQVRHLSHYMLFDLYDQLAREPGTVAKRAELAQTAATYLNQLQLSGDAPADLRLDLARSHRRLAAIQGLPGVSNLGRPDEARASLARAEAVLRALLADRPRDAGAWSELGWVMSDRWSLHGEGDGSAELNRQARAAFDRALALDPSASSAALGRIVTVRNEGYDLIWTDDRPAQALPLLRCSLQQLRARSWAEPEATLARRLEVHLLNRIGDATYYTGNVPGSLVPFQKADALVDAGIARDGRLPQWLILKGENAFNISGTLEELPARIGEALARADAGVAALKEVLSYGPDAAAEKKLLVLYGQQAALLDELGRSADALAPSNQSVALRRARLRGAPGDPQRMRDLAIGLAPHAELLARAGKSEPACTAATEAVAIWLDIRSRGRLGALDARKNLSHSETLKKSYCG
ncbi:serine/threonine protein kinase [Sphingomonas sp. ID1715]|uniref:serine/threonine-protein kinase n=1 Tax=Sphingomonas sp. ID1715 TaxID=1656898 RepID=UPI0014883035|nr:serine/threonine-protein kinase [Sphingomonas sp. ID1715]NNM75932.1 serine/threonine protein kinase [Sphingomonas sp. ID1715]